MPIDFYPNFSQQEREVALRKAQSRKNQGNITEVAAAGSRVVKDFGGNISVEREIEDLLYSLWLHDENDPKSWSNPHAQKIRHTRASYCGFANS